MVYLGDGGTVGLNLLGSCLVPVLLRLHIFALTATGMGFFLAKWQIAEQPSTASTRTQCREKSRTEQDQRGGRGGTDRARDGRAERGRDAGLWSAPTALSHPDLEIVVGCAAADRYRAYQCDCPSVL